MGKSCTIVLEQKIRDKDKLTGIYKHDVHETITPRPCNRKKRTNIRR
jgi:hypothetical protein